LKIRKPSPKNYLTNNKLCIICNVTEKDTCLRYGKRRLYPYCKSCYNIEKKKSHLACLASIINCNDKRNKKKGRFKNCTLVRCTQQILIDTFNQYYVEGEGVLCTISKKPVVVYPTGTDPNLVRGYLVSPERIDENMPHIYLNENGDQVVNIVPICRCYQSGSQRKNEDGTGECQWTREKWEYVKNYEFNETYTGKFNCSLLLGHAKSHSKIRNRTFSLTREYLDTLMTQLENRCALSGILFNFSGKGSWRPSLERIDESRGYVPGNVTFTCIEFNTGNVQWTHELFESQFDRACFKYN